MKGRDPLLLSARLSSLLEGEQLDRVHRQAHARSLLDSVGANPEAWPEFREDLDERAFYRASQLLTGGLELHGNEEHREVAQLALSRGAEELEYIAGFLPSPMHEVEALLRAGVGYRVAGFQARAYVLCSRAATRDSRLWAPAAVASLLMRGEMSEVRALCFEVLDSEYASDHEMAQALASAEVDESQAIDKIGSRALACAGLQFLEYLKSGRAQYLASSVGLCSASGDLGRDAGAVHLWWWGRALEKLLREFGNDGLWALLGDVGPDFPWGNPAHLYIEAHVTRTPATTSLWPSQRAALSMILDNDRPSFCVRLPTSAGKTKIAEIAIMNDLLGGGFGAEGRCLYVAPYRALAVEVEKSIGDGLRPLGLGVSELYGAGDFGRADSEALERAKVLILTPEKLEALARAAPEVISEVRLVILDEGHMTADISTRGLRAEFLFQRMLALLGRDQCRFILLSAVLPNGGEFAKWIGGSEESLVQSDWRPTRLVLGTCRWNGDRVRLEYSITDNQEPVDNVFVPRLLERREVRRLPGAGLRRNPVPHDANEAYAAAAIRLSSSGSTLAFVPQARQVASTARRMIKVQQLLSARAVADGVEPLSLAPDLESVAVRRCLSVIHAELGEDSEVAEFIKSGIGIHYGSLPKRVRSCVEDLVRKGDLRLLVATTSLGQGVNLPIKTVLVRGLQQDATRKVDLMGFWNIAGRAGRALHENDGQVLFFLDETERATLRWRTRQANRYMRQMADQHVVGTLHALLAYISSKWNELAPEIDFPDLCERLANGDLAWASEDATTHGNLTGILAFLDVQLLAISEESDMDTVDLDALQRSMEMSLLYVQMEAHPIEPWDTELVSDLLGRRLADLHQRYPSRTTRKRYYRMGVSMQDCAQIEAWAGDLRELVARAAEWNELGSEGQQELLRDVIGLALGLEAATENLRITPEHPVELSMGWVAGQSYVEMLEAGLAGDEDDAVGVAALVEQLCTYGLAWAVSSLLMFARDVDGGEQTELPAAAEYWPSMLKFGLPQPNAAGFAIRTGASRATCMQLAEGCPNSASDITGSNRWLASLSHQEMVDLGLDEDTARRIAALMQDRILDWTEWLPADHNFTVPMAEDQLDSAPSEGDQVVLRPTPLSGERSFRAYSVHGERLGSYRWRTEPADAFWMSRPDLALATVTKVERTEDGGVSIAIRARRLSE